MRTMKNWAECTLQASLDFIGATNTSHWASSAQSLFYICSSQQSWLAISSRSCAHPKITPNQFFDLSRPNQSFNLSPPSRSFHLTPLGLSRDIRTTCVKGRLRKKVNLQLSAARTLPEVSDTSILKMGEADGYYVCTSRPAVLAM